MTKLLKLLQKLLLASLQHLSYFREIYVLLPVALLLVIGSIYGVSFLTGRAVVDDPGELVNQLYVFFKCVLIIILTGFCKGHIFDDLPPEKEAENPVLYAGVPWWRRLIDSGETVFLLLLFTWVFFR